MDKKPAFLKGHGRGRGRHTNIQENGGSRGKRFNQVNESNKPEVNAACSPSIPPNPWHKKTPGM